MLGPSPPMRTLGKAKLPSQDAPGSQGSGGGAGNGLSRTMPAPVESLSPSSSSAANNNVSRSSSSVDSLSSLDSSGCPSHSKVALKARGKGHSPPTPPTPLSGAISTTAAAASPTPTTAPTVESLWSPSRLVALLPPDPEAFELVEAATSWAMDHTAVCDALLHLAGTLHVQFKILAI